LLHHVVWLLDTKVLEDCAAMKFNSD